MTPPLMNTLTARQILDTVQWIMAQNAPTDG